MRKALFVVLAGGAVAACSVPVTPEDVFVADPDYRRTDFQTLNLLNEDEMPSGSALRHEWLASEIGPLGLSWAQQLEGAHADRLIVTCMGNTTDRQSDGVRYLGAVLPFGDAVIFDYPGYGDSAGPPTLKNFELALSAVADRVKTEPYDRVMVWGHSMGGFFCSRLFKHLGDELEGVVLEATFSDTSAISRFGLPWYLKPFIRVKLDERLLRYDSVAALDGFDGPITVLAGEADRELPIAATRDLASKLEARGHDVLSLEFSKAGHYDIAEQPDYVERTGAAINRATAE
ncbi:MAG: alpha/beta fold hydrolase [Pseudomonadota bacterium]